MRLHDGLLQILEVSSGKQTLVGFKVGSRSVRGRPVTLGLRLLGPVTPGACDLPAKFAGSTSKTVSRPWGEGRCDSVALVVQFRVRRNEVCVNRCRGGQEEVECKRRVELPLGGKMAWAARGEGKKGGGAIDIGPRFPL